MLAPLINFETIFDRMGNICMSSSDIFAKLFPYHIFFCFSIDQNPKSDILHENIFGYLS